MNIIKWFLEEPDSTMEPGNERNLKLPEGYTSVCRMSSLDDSAVVATFENMDDECVATFENPDEECTAAHD